VNPAFFTNDLCHVSCFHIGLLLCEIAGYGRRLVDDGILQNHFGAHLQPPFPERPHETQDGKFLSLQVVVTSPCESGWLVQQFENALANIRI
jgi:hypothetical protein